MTRIDSGTVSDSQHAPERRAEELSCNSRIMAANWAPWLGGRHLIHLASPADSRTGGVTLATALSRSLHESCSCRWIGS